MSEENPNSENNSQEAKKTSNVNKKQYTDGNILKQLITNSIPMIFALGFMLSFSLIDTYFVAKLGTKQLAAITFAFPIVFILTGVAMGLGNGASAVISKAVGKGDERLVKRLTTDSIFIALVLVLLFSIFGTIFLDEIFILLKASNDILPYIKSYMQIIFIGAVFLVVPLVGNSATRAIGDTKTPSMIMFISVIVNIILDPILLFGWGPIPSFGIAGAAWATVFTRIITLSVSIYILHFRDNMLTFDIPTYDEFISSAKSILQVGIPSVATNLIVPVGFGIIVGFVAKYGQDAVAGLGAASRIEIVMLAVFMAFSTVLGPFVGQNLGAQKLERIKKAINYGHTFAILWGILTSLILYIFAEPIARTFKDDDKVVAIMIMYLQIAPISIGLRGITINVTTTLNVLKKPLLASFLSISQVFLIFIPLAYFLSNYTQYGLKGIFYASLISSIVVSIISYIILHKYIKVITNEE